MFVHLVPGTLFFLHWLFLSDVVLKACHIFAFLPVMLIYCYINYLDAMSRGEYLYSFLDWPGDFWGAIRNLVLMSLGFAVIFTAKAKFT